MQDMQQKFLQEPRQPPLALVTGATRRVGAAIALELARSGFDLVITYRNDSEGAKQVQRQVQELGRRCTMHALDLATLHDASFLSALALGKLDVLVFNAAAWSASPWGALRAQSMLEHLQVNAVAPVLMAQALQPLLNASTLPSGASVIAIGDMYAQGKPVRGYASYLMSKAALTQAVQQMALEMAPRIRVNAILPSVVSWPDSIDAATRAAMLDRVPLARVGEPEDVARLVRFLALEASYLTGATIPLDGGRSLR